MYSNFEIKFSRGVLFSKGGGSAYSYGNIPLVIFKAGGSGSTHASFFNLSAEPLSFGPRLYLLISLWNEKTHVCWVWSLTIDVPSYARV